jgi:hypothetical protein
MTSVIPQRPLSLEEIYRGAKDVLVRNRRLLLGIGFAVSVVSELLALPVRLGFEHNLRSMLVDRSFTSGDVVRDVVSSATSSLLVAIIGFVLGLAVTAVAIVVVRGEVIGRPATPRAAVDAGVAKLGRLALMTLMLCGAALAGFLVVFALMVAIGPAGVLLSFAWLLVCVYFAVLFSLASAAIVVEDAGVMDSLQRSKALVTGGWWRVFGILLLTELVFAVVSWLLGLVLAGWLVSIVVGTVSTPALVCVVALLYFDYRFRKEGSGISPMSQGVEDH